MQNERGRTTKLTLLLTIHLWNQSRSGENSVIQLKGKKKSETPSSSKSLPQCIHYQWKLYKLCMVISHARKKGGKFNKLIGMKSMPMLWPKSSEWSFRIKQQWKKPKSELMLTFILFLKYLHLLPNAVSGKHNASKYLKVHY